MDSHVHMSCPRLSSVSSVSSTGSAKNSSISAIEKIASQFVVVPPLSADSSEDSSVDASDDSSCSASVSTVVVRGRVAIRCSLRLWPVPRRSPPLSLPPHDAMIAATARVENDPPNDATPGHVSTATARSTAEARAERHFSPADAARSTPRTRPGRPVDRYCRGHGRPVPRRLDRSGDPRAHGDRRDRQRDGADRFADDPRRDRRHDRLGQDRPRRDPDRGGAPGRAAGAGDRPEGRPHQPLPHVPRPRPRRLPPVDRRGPGAQRRRDARRVRREPGDAVDARASAGWGLGGTDIGALRDRDRLHDLHARLAGRRAARTSSARCRCPPT